jgi:hypothetical protein
MANWLNVRLAVIGKYSQVHRLSRRTPVGRSSAIFDVSMLHGEGGDLSGERLKRIGDLGRKVYRFQMRGDDGARHFRRVSRRHPTLSFIVVYCDPNGDERGSYLIEDGRSRRYVLPSEAWVRMLDKHGYSDEQEDDLAYWEASWEAMDVCQAEWEELLLNRRRRLHSTLPEGRRTACPSRTKRRGPTASRPRAR